MDFKSQAQEIYRFLLPFKNLWSEEVMNTYPESFKLYPQEWLESLMNLTEEELYQFDSNENILKLQGTSLAEHINQINNLINLESIESINKVKLEDWAWVDIKFKKRHEIEILSPYLKSLQNKLNFEKIIDIGGGVGHLSRILAYYYEINCICIDKDESFQTIGKNRLVKYRKPQNAKDIEFNNIHFGNKKDNEKLIKLINNKTLTIGLHTCGSLANTLLSSSVELNGHALLSFGCCYHKLNDTNDFPISTLYKDHLNLGLNLFAKTLASRAHGKTTFEDFKIRKQVKYYRSALHLFLLKKLNIPNCFDVGEVKNVKEYFLPFSSYANSKLQHLKINHPYSLLNLDHFYYEQSVQEDIKKIFLLSEIRWKFGRLLELYILLDRVIYLTENNYNVELKTFFNESISPRNIGVLGIKSN